MFLAQDLLHQMKKITCHSIFYTLNLHIFQCNLLFSNILPPPYTIYNDKTIIMEFLANNMDDLKSKMAFSDFDTLKSIISAMVFIHSKNSVEVFDKETLQKYLG